MTRNEKIKERLFNNEYFTKKEWWGGDKTILTSEEIKREPLIVRKALAIAYTLENMPIEIKPDELIVGISTMSSCALGNEIPEYALPEEEEEVFARSSFTVKSVWGHYPPRYETLLEKGLSGIREHIYQKLSEESDKQTPNLETLSLYRAMLISIKGVKTLSERYATLALKEANNTTDPARRKELIEISKICSKVPENTPETFHEALQSCYLMFIALQSTLEFVPVARSDQYLYPFYRKDIDNGRLTVEKAKELVCSWIAKFNERVQLDSEHWEKNHATGFYQRDGIAPDSDETENTNNAIDDSESWKEGTSVNHWLLNMILGGQNERGEDATNELTYIILEQWSFLEVVMPVLSVRFHKNSPQKLYEVCADILRNGSGEPAIYNDEKIIEGLVRRGIPIEEARCYSNDGCWETLIPGKTNFSFGNIDVLQLLEYQLNEGVSLVRGKKEFVSIGSPAEWETFEDFYQAYIKLMELKTQRILEEKIQFYKDRYAIAPSPLLSTIMDDCIERGQDVSLKGAKYNIYSLIIASFSHFIDSIAAIKKMVYEEKKVSLDTLINALRKNYEGYEDLRQMMINQVPKFGNDNPYTDEIATRFMKDFEESAFKVSEKIDMDDFHLGLGIGTFEVYMTFGWNIGASPDGRLMHESVASNYSPSIGLDVNGPTAAIRSITAPDLVPYCVGCPLDIQMNSNEVIGESGLKRLIGLIKSFMDLGGLMLTITGVKPEDLIDAQINPMKHKSLRVRMGGLSAYFIALSKEHQDIMIQKVKHGV